MKVAIFDTETTGLPQSKIINPLTFDKWPYIVQFSYIIYDCKKNKIVKSVDAIIKIPIHVNISEYSIKLHGITQDVSQTNGSSIDKILCEFIQDIKGVDLVIGHNILFDVNMVKVELLRLIYEPNESRYKISALKDQLYHMTYIAITYCTMEKSKALCNILITNKYGNTYVKFPKLIELYEFLFKETPKNLHNSFIDILVTLRCYYMLEFKNDIYDIDNQVKLLIEDNLY